MNSSPLVSVVIPSYNHAAFVVEAISSVAAQDWSRIELIVIDDGSKDDSVRRIRTVLKDVPFESTRLVEQANAGAHAAINHGMELSSGDFIQILNSDDRLAPSRLTRLIEALDRSQTDCVFSDVRVIDEGGKPAPMGHPMNVWYRNAADTAANEPSVGFGLLRYNMAVTTSNFLFRRSLLKRVGGFTPERLAHDWRFLLRVLIWTEPLWVRERLLDYRFHRSNTATRVLNLGRTEGEVALREYLRSATRHPPENRRAPSPFWWPSFFALFLETRQCWFATEPMSAFAPRLKDFDSD